MELTKLLTELNNIEKPKNTLIKIYYIDKDNYTIKLINYETHQKIYTKRKSTNKALKNVDHNYYEKKDN